ncbi:uncharacterized protein A4U43_C01F2130 [Asparagus officinalis]|uniref:Uncharacterized protein n=1 Tax=Asparagus officinalis TaxID=4686 RepID=A0A5P1FLC3_ASPOF|nr:uncharacterized protein A4U43_C01F2130 [Asparagus officinalis]
MGEAYKGRLGGVRAGGDGGLAGLGRRWERRWRRWAEADDWVRRVELGDGAGVERRRLGAELEVRSVLNCSCIAMQLDENQGYQGHVSAALVHGIVIVTGPHLHIYGE